MKIALRVLLISVSIFALLRLSLFYTYSDYFSDVNFWKAELIGIRFDLKLAVIALSPLLLILISPFYLPNKIQKFLSWVGLTVLSMLVIIAIADIAYFGEVHRHISSEIITIVGDINFLWQTGISTRFSYTIFGILVLITLFFTWKIAIIKPITQTKKNKGNLFIRSLKSILSLIFLFFLARGMVLHGKPLDSIDAFNNQGQEAANLSLNGSLVALKSILDQKNPQPLIYLTKAQSAQFSKLYPNPFSYTPKPYGDQPKNIVFILLESWSYQFIDGLSGSKYGVTPNMDKLIQQSSVWHNYYAAGQRSIVGIQAALTSVPALPKQETLGFGLELNNMSRIAELAQQKCYRTIMIQSSKRRSFHMDGIAKAIGFKEYYGQEDIPVIKEYPQSIPAFGWDYDTLMFLGKKINEQPNTPFFAFLFTGTTHEPFADPGAEFHAYPHDKKSENGFLNTLKYSDWSVHEFMQFAAKQSWYKDTIFVFSADHTLNSGNASHDLKSRFHIPLIIFSPTEAPKSYQNLASQYDLLPTFADYLHINQTVYSFGKSLVNNDAPITPVMLNQGESTGMIFHDETAQFQGKHIISGKSSPALQFLQWRMQTADTQLRQNQWIPR